MRIQDILLALLVPLIWGFGIVFAKAALEHFPPILLMAFRFEVTALAMIWFVKPPWRLMGKIFLISLVSAALQYGFTFTGLKYLDASTAAGMLAGALTSAPTFAAASEVAPDATRLSVAFALTYPFGLVGLVLAVQLLPGLFGDDLSADAATDDELSLGREQRDPVVHLVERHQWRRADAVVDANVEVIGPERFVARRVRRLHEVEGPDRVAGDRPHQVP